LDPLEASALKMSTVFTGAFTLPDLAASSCSRYSGASNLDRIRLLKAVDRLHRKKLIEAVKDPEACRRGSPVKGADDDDTLRDDGKYMDKYFIMDSMLLRKVGQEMVLEAQRKAVKRQALMDRALARELPERLDRVRVKNAQVHIPWYYEVVLPMLSGHG